MDIFKTLKQMFTTLLLLSFFSFTATPILGWLGISPPSQLTAATEFTKLAIVFVFAALVVTVLIIFVLGYFTLTGWRNYKAVPKLLRLFLAFILGYVVFTASGPIAMLVPVPILPMIIVAILLWIVLRFASSLIINEGSNNRDNTIKIERAISEAKAFLSKMDFLKNEVDVQESKMTDGIWEVLLLAKNSGEKYKVKIDGSSGGIVEWAKA